MIIKNKTTFSFSNIDATFNRLPVGVYILTYDDKLGIVLKQTTPFTIPSKIYGDIHIVDKVVNTFNSRPNKNLGVLFEGLKGCSKTLTCKLICQKLNLPVILIQEDFTNMESKIVDFFSNPELGNCIILFDEFDKTFNDCDSQVPILTLLDGTINTHHLYLFTANESRYRKELVNRPSRIYYHLVSSKLDSLTIEAVIDDLLVDKSKKEELIKILDNFLNLNFDILISIIEEANRYDTPIKELVRDFGFSFESIAIRVTCIPNGKTIEYDATHDSLWTFGTFLGVIAPIPGKSMKDDWKYQDLNPEQIKRVRNHWETIDDEGNKYIIKPIEATRLLF